MSPETYITISIFLFVLRIVITVYCINKASSLGRNKTGWGVFGFFIPVLAFIWIQFMKPKTESKTTEKAIAQDLNEQEKDKIHKLKSSLESLKRKKLIEEKEYLEKIKHLHQQEKEIIFKETTERLDKLINEKTKQTLSELDQLYNSGILNEKEYSDKKSRLLGEKYAFYKSYPYLNPDFNLQMQVFKKSLLPYRFQKQIDEAIPTLIKDQFILYNKISGRLEKSSLEELSQLDNSKNRRNYLCIDIFN